MNTSCLLGFCHRSNKKLSLKELIYLSCGLLKKIFSLKISLSYLNTAIIFVRVFIRVAFGNGLMPPDFISWLLLRADRGFHSETTPGSIVSYRRGRLSIIFFRKRPCLFNWSHPKQVFANYNQPQKKYKKISYVK
jgi:hypothetical protein